MNQEQLTKETLSVEALNDLILDSIQDIKGNDIVKLDLRQLTEAPTDFFIICHGNSDTQVKAIASNIMKELKTKAGENVFHVEGQTNGTWVLLDYFNTIIHVFHHETRKFYNLEGLWSDAISTEYGNL